jgi:tetratricopeptide (TPR) repeat protein
MDEHRRRHEMPEAEATAAEAVARFPDSVDISIAYGRILLLTYRAEEAAQVFLRAEQLAPQNDRPAAWRVAALSRQRLFDEAIAAGIKATQRLPNSSLVRVALGRVFLDSSRPEQALEHFARAATTAPHDIRAINWHAAGLAELHRWPEAQTVIRKAIERDPAETKLYFQLGWILIDDCSREAIEYFDIVLNRAPQHPQALEWRSTALRNLRRFSEAEEATAGAIRLLPRCPRLYVEHAWVSSDQDREDEAVTRVDGALAIDPRHSWALRSRMNFLQWARRFEEAEQAAAEAIERRPDDPDIHTAAAWVASDQDHYDEATARVDRALAIDPRHSWALRSRISILQAAPRFEEAEQAAAEAIERRPDDPDIHTAAAWFSSDRDREDEAVTRMDRALAIDPRHSWALRNRIYILRAARRFEEAEQAAAEAIERRPDDPEIHTAAAWVASDQDHYDEAAARVDRALAIDPRHSWALRSRVDFLRWARRFSEAEEAAAEAIERRPDDPDIHTTAAWFSSDQDREDEAVTRIDRALAIDPRHSWALRSRMNFLQRARRFEEAEQAAAEAIERRPDDPDIHTTAAWFSSDQDREDEAVTRMDRALAIDPRHSWALRNRIYILRAARRFEEAEQAAAEAIERRPDDPEIHTAAAWVASDQDHYDEAAARVDRALAIDPRHSWALRSRISILQAARRFEEAEQAAAEAIELSPKDSGIRVELGRMKDYRREFEPALLCLAIVLARDPDHVEANVAKSAVLRSMRRCAEARREITRLSKLKPEVRELKFELGQIHHDERRLVEARKVFRDLLATAANADEHAEAHHSLGWVAFTETDFITAEQEFRAAIEQQPGDLDYELALAWALTRQGGRRREEEAEQIATKVVERRPDPSAHVCLGVLAFKRGGLAASEYHLNQALQIDPWHGSHTDLGALYSHIGRYDDAESELRQAVTRDWYDTVAHVELGRLFLQLGEQRLPDAEREFRQALACDPTSSSAAIGLAQALEKAGDEIAAESTLRQALRRQEAGDTWRTFLALARLLVQRGDKQQNSDLLADAYAQAQRAIGLAPDAEADPHFVAGVALHRLGSLSVTAVVDRDLDCVVAGHGYHAEQRVVLA